MHAKNDLLNEIVELKQRHKIFVAYKGDKNDEIDLMLASALNRNNSILGQFLRRLSPGKYLFGTRKIIAKIMNGKLVIRVGGGYMSADEFIE